MSLLKKMVQTVTFLRIFSINTQRNQLRCFIDLYAEGRRELESFESKNKVT
jgi:hypothetical protein